ncbi:hypothetical protein ACQB60_10100 [Actinomycetota bacterium Odt1-20B]
MITPEDVPHFVGDLGQLQQHAAGLRTNAAGIRRAGSAAHTKFQALAAFYHAPEAGDLFSSTAPVRDSADLFADKVEIVAEALDEYASAVEPIKAKLADLKAKVTTFVAGLKTDGGEIDEDWTQDQDKIDEYQGIWDGIAAAKGAFTAAEIAANNKITALVGGTQYVAQGDKGTLIPRGSKVYGYTGDALKHAKELPWGTPETRTYSKWDVGHHIENVSTDFKDLAVGTVTGLYDLFDTGEDGKYAREGLMRVFVGVDSYLLDPRGDRDDLKPGVKQFLDESRPYPLAFAKGMVGWDDWSTNPDKAATTLAFNGLTLASGPLAAVSKMARAGGVAKTAGTVAKVGEAIDPISAVAKTIGATTRHAPRIAEVTARIRAGVGDVPQTGSVSTRWKYAENAELHISNGEVTIVKNGTPDTTPALVEPRADQRTPSTQTPHEPELVGIGGRAPEGAAAHASGKLPHQAGHSSASGTGAGAASGGGGGHATASNGSGPHHDGSASAGSETHHGSGGGGQDHGARHVGHGDERPHLMRQDDNFRSEHNHKGQRKSHLNSDGDLVPANPDGEATIVDHIVGRDPRKSDSPYTSLSRNGADAKAFGTGKIIIDLPRLERDIASGRVTGVDVYSPEQVQAALQADADRIAGHHVDLTVPPGSSRAEVQEIAQSLGLSKGKTKRVAQRMVDMMNTTRDEEWLIKGVVPHEYITGPHGG